MIAHGRREAERAGAADDERADRAGEGEGETPPREQPAEAGQRGDADDGGHEHSGHPIRDAGDRRLRRRGVGDHFDDLRESRVLADAGRAAAEEAGLVDRRGGDDVPRALSTGMLSR
jgi:hypothetical protein